MRHTHQPGDGIKHMEGRLGWAFCDLRPTTAPMSYQSTSLGQLWGAF